MHITVLTPDKKVFEGEITSVKVPGTLGQFQVLKNHAPIVSSLQEGAVEIVTAAGNYDFYDTETGTIQTANVPGAKIIYKISGGFIEVLNNEISLLLENILKR
ncbi:MAG TPA: hypothetical protein PKC40_12860 [Saprospiraceae bacterium]|nr:hypothetical protein [Saprospiraceae bacterium]